MRHLNINLTLPHFDELQGFCLKATIFNSYATWVNPSKGGCGQLCIIHFQS